MGDVAANWPADRVERWSLDELVPYARNSRTHSDAQVAQLAASIEQFGWTIPVLVAEDGTLIAGHGRVLAARLLGLTEVPVMVARGWTEEQRRAYTIADNKLAENAGWDLGALAVEMADLVGSGFDPSVIGFNDAEVAGLLAGSPSDEDEIDREWRGMPEFVQADKQAFRTIPIHFKDQAAVDAFAALVGQAITAKTRFLWFPEIEIERYADKRYTAERADT